MRKTSCNELQCGPLSFLRAYHAFCADLVAHYGADGVPDVTLINQLCEEHNMGYRIEGERLLVREEVEVDVVAYRSPAFSMRRVRRSGARWPAQRSY
jgi:hypothetical protein